MKKNYSICCAETGGRRFAVLQDKLLFFGYNGQESYFWREKP
ncbi:hypothetical protein [Desulfotruncus arcticus]|nr:hypothetical protein [Desulfotruncus arcticus]